MRLFDIVGGLLASLIALPMIGVAAVAIQITEGRPLFYRARRLGPGGRPIMVLKLRTMREGSQGGALTLRDDARIFPLGRALRRFRIDELPQLWNVLRGDMSLVGPRPEDPAYVDWSIDLHRKVFSAKPGITGLAQLEYRSEGELLVGADADRMYREEILPSKLRLDAYYLDHRSVRFALVILGRTVVAIVYPMSRQLVGALPGSRSIQRVTRRTVGRVAAAASRVALALRGRHLLILDLGAIALALGLAFLLHSDYPGGFVAISSYTPAALIPLVIRPIVNVSLGLYQRLWRHASVPELAQVLTAGIIGSILAALLFYVVLVPLGVPGTFEFPRSFWVLEGVLSLVFMGGIRFAIRAATGMDTRGVSISGSGSQRSRALLYGAGQAGLLIARSAMKESAAGVEPVGFLDDDAGREGERLAGLPIYGSLNALVDAVTLTRAQVLLITIPSAAGAAIRRATEAGLAAGLDVRTVPPVRELVDGSIDAYRIRRVRVEDLIRRPVATSLTHELERAVRGRSVLITGAGGSIGSELARQVYAMHPASIVLVDRAESPLFVIDRELEACAGRGRGSGSRTAEIVDVSNRQAMRRLFDRVHPHVIFHAAAYKHVPLMEAHPSEAVQANVGGTLAVLDAAIGAGVSNFILVSTDKAVAPTSVMGATKRVAEWLVQEAARLTDRHFVAVRFGNVLGSTGSVLPILQNQLESGQALTITHPDMTRYFMTIPEACALILRATIIGTPGSIMVLDMGEPIRIVDLARDLIRLAGRDPDTVPIVFTGLRPGERLREQLFNEDEIHGKTISDKVMFAAGRPPPPDIRQVALQLLAAADGTHDQLVRDRLFALVNRARQVDAAPASSAPPSSQDGVLQTVLGSG